MRLVASVTVALLAVFFWRNGQVYRNLFVAPWIPNAYFIGGDAHSQCTVIQDGAHKLSHCEDAVSWHVSNNQGINERRLLVSCDPGRRLWNTVMGPLSDPNPRGALWVYAPEAREQVVQVALDGYPKDADFHPLGIDVFPGITPYDPSHVIVVNHGRHNSTIEQFLLSPTAPYRATYVRTLTNPAFVSPNAVAFTSSSSFYLSQDHYFTRRLHGLVGKILPVLETLTLPGLAWVNHVTVNANGRLDITNAAQGIPFSNGISVSKDGTKVAVASSSSCGVHLYNRTGESELKFEETVSLPFAPDNLGFEDDGSLIVAGHPDFIALTNLIAGKRDNAPSWIVSITPRTGSFHSSDAKQQDAKAPYPVSRRAPISLNHEIKTLYQSDGSGFSTSTTGLWDARSGEFFAVGLYTEGILACRVN